MSESNIPFGNMKWGDALNNPNAFAFAVRSILLGLQTATLVRVEKCTNNGGLAEMGTVEVTPLVNQIDGQGIAHKHGVIVNVPYFRMQGGANAMIIDPAPGDIGFCVFASRDISKVKATKAQANPGSFRHHDWADALYIGGLLNAIPTQYIQFSADGIVIHSPTKVKIEAPAIELAGPVTATSTIVATGNVTGQGTSLHTHVHGGVQTGGGTTGGPQ